MPTSDSMPREPACRQSRDQRSSIHANYLFEVSEAQHEIEKPETFWVHNTTRTACASTNVYLDTKDLAIPKISSILLESRFPDRLLHPDYYLKYRGLRLETWLQWLQRLLGPSSVLRIVDPKQSLTPELRLAQIALPNVLLDALLATWSKDKSIFESKIVRDMVGALEATCMNGQRARINQTCLPTSKVKGLAVEGLLFLHVTKPDDKRWSRLESLVSSSRPIQSSICAA
jgi:hypothetical protein